MRIRYPWEKLNRVSLHPARRQTAVATPNFDERWPWVDKGRPQAVEEPDCIRLVDVVKIDKACAQWLANRDLQVSWRRTF